MKDTMKRSISNEIVKRLAKYRTPPTTKALSERLQFFSPDEIEQTLREMLADGVVAVSDGKWRLRGSAPAFGHESARRPKRKRKLDPKSAAARTIDMFGGEK